MNILRENTRGRKAEKYRRTEMEKKKFNKIHIGVVLKNPGNEIAKQVL